MQINFYPESDNSPDYELAAKEYAKIWEESKGSIVKALEKVSGMKFKTKLINAFIYSGHNYSIPLMLRYSNEKYYIRSILMHELSHRLLIDNGFMLPLYDNFVEEVHKIIYLFVYEAWIEALGQEVADKSKERDLSFKDPRYMRARNWAWSFSKEDRRKEFEKMKLKYQKKALNNPF